MEHDVKLRSYRSAEPCPSALWGSEGFWKYGPVALGDAPKKGKEKHIVSLKKGAYVSFFLGQVRPRQSNQILLALEVLLEFGMLWNNGALFDFEILILTLKSSSPYFYIDLMITFGNRTEFFFFFFGVAIPPDFLKKPCWPWTLHLEPPFRGSVWQGATRRATVSKTGKDVLPVRFETGEEVNRKKMKKTLNFGEIWSVGILGKADLLTWIRRRFFFWQFYGWNVCTLKQTCNIFFLRSMVCIKNCFLIQYNIYIYIYT